MSALPPGLHRAFQVAVADLGLCSAAWLFAEEAHAVGGPGMVTALRDALGSDWPVLDTVAAAKLEGASRPVPDATAMLRACGNATHIVCVGIEAHLLDALVRATPLPISLLGLSVFGPDWERVAANYGGRIRIEPLETFQRLAGPRSVLMTFAYGAAGDTTHVLPAWIRVHGEDVRTQFRSLVAWEVLDRPFFVYPRWLVPVPLSTFSDVVRG